MPNEDVVLGGQFAARAVHASAVAISGIALLILGPSRSGKSRLAVRLIAASTRRQAIRLVGDDRILLEAGPSGLVARPHPRIAGFIERRGLGLIASPFVAAAPVGGLVALGPTTPPDDLVQNFPCLFCVNPHEVDAATVLVWWRGLHTTQAINRPVLSGKA